MTLHLALTSYSRGHVVLESVQCAVLLRKKGGPHVGIFVEMSALRGHRCGARLRSLWLPFIQGLQDRLKGH